MQYPVNTLNQKGHFNTVNEFSRGGASSIVSHSISTILRVVYDASAKTDMGNYPNDRLFIGPVVQDYLFSVVVRFRWHWYGLTAYIEKMYRQILWRVVKQCKVSWCLLSAVRTQCTQQEPVTKLVPGETECIAATRERTAWHPLHVCCVFNCITTAKHRLPRNSSPHAAALIGEQHCAMLLASDAILLAHAVGVRFCKLSILCCCQSFINYGLNLRLGVYDIQNKSDLGSFLGGGDAEVRHGFCRETLLSNRIGWKLEHSSEDIRDGASCTGNMNWGRNGEESVMAFVRDPSLHSPGVITENHRKPKSGWPSNIQALYIHRKTQTLTIISHVPDFVNIAAVLLYESFGFAIAERNAYNSLIVIAKQAFRQLKYPADLTREIRRSVFEVLSRRYTQYDENTVRQFRALRLAAMGHLMHVAVSTLSLSRTSRFQAQGQSLVYITMAYEKTRRRIAPELCVELRKSGQKTFEMIKQEHAEEATGKSETGQEFLNRIVIADKSWNRSYYPEPEQQPSVSKNRRSLCAAELCWSFDKTSDVGVPIRIVQEGVVFGHCTGLFAEGRGQPPPRLLGDLVSGAADKPGHLRGRATPLFGRHYHRCINNTWADVSGALRRRQRAPPRTPRADMKPELKTTLTETKRQVIEDERSLQSQDAVLRYKIKVTSTISGKATQLDRRSCNLSLVQVDNRYPRHTIAASVQQADPSQLPLE
ncbi:hypothetical protein PR048_023096 [Dryococelus australis]|uniref:Uncharacterized protein n=1 Tax=Dryococelus australis TaxID=614101 RepID=A0ABQ9GT43_9NEOP|nr:hypothetical protein PR048_023096 [Dryococelus australis]